MRPPPSLFALVVVAALAACGPQRAADAPAAGRRDEVVQDPRGFPVHRDGACGSYPAMLARQDAIEARNRAAFARALAEAGLAEARYPVDSFDVDRAARDDGAGWQVVDASDRRTLLSPATPGGCGSGPWQLAVDGRGHLFALEVQRREIARHELSVCGCDDQVPVTCGGAMPPPIRWRWTLPRDVVFDGAFSVVVEHESTLPVFTGKADGSPCPVRALPP